MKILEYDFATGDILDVYDSIEQIERSKRRQQVIKRVLKGQLYQAYGKGYIDLDTGVEPFRYIRETMQKVKLSKIDNRLRNKYKTTWI